MASIRLAARRRRARRFIARLHVQGHQLIQTPGTKAFQVEGNELEAEAAELADEPAADGLGDQPRHLGDRHLDAGEIALVIAHPAVAESERAKQRLSVFYPPRPLRSDCHPWRPPAGQA